MSSNGVTGLAVAVDAVADVDLSGLCVAELQALTGALSGLLDRLAGVRVSVLGELSARSGGRVPSVPDVDAAAGPVVPVQSWLRDLTGVGGPAAGQAVRYAAALRELPLVLAAVRSGELGFAQAVVLTRLVGVIDPVALAEAEPNLLLVAAERDPQSLGAYVAHLVATHCEPQFEADSRSQQARRYLQTSRESDGMLSGRFRLTSADSEAFLTVLEPLARRASLLDERDAGQRRADALVEVCGQVLRHGDLPDAGGLRPQVSYVVPAGWAAGQSPVGSFADLVGRSLAGHSVAGDSVVGDLFGSDGWAGVPVEGSCAVGAWSGPQTRSTIETVLCDARLTRVLLDPAGQVTGLQALGDSITTAQRRALAARDRGCAVRGCTRPPAFCDAHHLDSRADGGATSIGNLVLLCRRHHTLWHQGKLRLHHLHVPWILGTHDPPF